MARVGLAIVEEGRGLGGLRPFFVPRLTFNFWTRDMQLIHGYVSLFRDFKLWESRNMR